MEDFSQSRGDDDLFDDEIIPVESSHEDAPTSQVQQITLQSQAAHTTPRSLNGDHSRGPRGRGRGGPPRESSKKNDLAGSKWATPAPAPVPKEITAPSQEPSDQTTVEAEPAPAVDAASDTVSSSAPVTQTPSRPAAVRGDRTGTGGVKKPKLTEDELTAKLLAAKERSQNISAAHARAQADAASFEERERVAQQKRAKEAVNRRQMDNERQKNAARKAAAMGGREWDEDKHEEDFRIQSGRGGARQRGGQVRTMNGASVNRRDPENDDLSQYQWHEGRGRGRGDRGKGRGGARGGRGATRQPNVKAEADFPSLPAATPAKDEKQPSRPEAKAAISDALSPSGEKTSWADQVGEEAKA